MQNPPNGPRRAKARNKNTTYIVPPASVPTQDLAAQSPHQLSLFNAPAQATVPIAPCAQCGETQGKQTPGRGPHFAQLRCATCNRFIKWIGKPRGAA